MIDRFKADFGLTQLCESDNQILLGAIKGLSLHLLVVDGSYFQQYYLPRFEIARHLALQQKGVKSKRALLSTEMTLRLSQTELTLEIDSVVFSFSTKDYAVGKRIVADLKYYQTLELSHAAPDTKDVVKYYNHDEDAFWNTLGELDRRALLFECGLMAKSRSKYLLEGVHKVGLYKISPYDPFYQFIPPIESILNKFECFCGSSFCAFEQLDENLEKHFGRRAEFQTDGQFDEDKAREKFDGVWNATPLNGQCAIMYMAEEIGLSPLLSFDLAYSTSSLHAVCDIFTECYQPDSEEEAQVRQVLVNANAYAFMSREAL